MHIFLIVIGSILLLSIIYSIIEILRKKKMIKERIATGNYPEARWCYDDEYGFPVDRLLSSGYDSLIYRRHVHWLKEIRDYHEDKAPFTLMKALMRTVKPAIGTENGYTRVYFKNFSINNIMEYMNGSPLMIRNSRIIYHYTDATNFVIDVYKFYTYIILYEYITARDHLSPSEEEALYNYNKTEEMVRSELERIEWADYVGDKVDIHYYFDKENIFDTVKQIRGTI